MVGRSDNPTNTSEDQEARQKLEDYLKWFVDKYTGPGNQVSDLIRGLTHPCPL